MNNKDTIMLHVAFLDIAEGTTFPVWVKVTRISVKD